MPGNDVWRAQAISNLKSQVQAVPSAFYVIPAQMNLPNSQCTCASGLLITTLLADL